MKLLLRVNSVGVNVTTKLRKYSEMRRPLFQEAQRRGLAEIARSQIQAGERVWRLTARQRRIDGRGVYVETRERVHV